MDEIATKVKSRIQALEYQVTPQFEIEAEMYREARWVAMLGMNNANTIGLRAVPEGSGRGCNLLDILEELGFPLSSSEVRSIFLHLHACGFCHFDGVRGFITPQGLALCRYEIPTPADIARPETKWWDE